MEQKISQRYQKALVTVAMGFRTEEDIKKNDLYRFIKSEKDKLIEYVTKLFNKNKSVLALKVRQTGYRSEHIDINSEDDLNSFITNLDNIFEKDNEIWVISSSVIECWRCRVFLSIDSNNDLLEMAYSYDDHILDHIESNEEVPYICYKKENNIFKISNTNLKEDKLEASNLILQNILRKYSNIFTTIKEDLEFIGIDGISLDIRVDNGYNFHDFDVAYGDVEKVIKYYLPQLTKSIYK